MVSDLSLLPVMRSNGWSRGGGRKVGEAESPPMTQSSLFLTPKGALAKEDKKDRCRGGHNYRNVPGTRSISEGRGEQEGAGDSGAQWVLGAVRYRYL